MVPNNTSANWLGTFHKTRCNPWLPRQGSSTLVAEAELRQHSSECLLIYCYTLSHYAVDQTNGLWNRTPFTETGECNAFGIIITLQTFHGACLNSCKSHIIPNCILFFLFKALFQFTFASTLFLEFILVGDIILGDLFIIKLTLEFLLVTVNLILIFTQTSLSKLITIRNLVKVSVIQTHTHTISIIIIILFL